jgi:hypothetical protein
MESIRDIISRALPFLSDEERQRAVRVREKYVSDLGNIANEYFFSVLITGAKFGAVKHLGCRKVVSLLIRKMEELYSVYVEPERADRGRRAALMLALMQDGINRQLIPDYRSPFDDPNPRYAGLREHLN